MAGGLRKINKLALLHKLEKGVETITSNMDKIVIIIDETAIVQKAKTSGLTFGELAKQPFTTTLAIGTTLAMMLYLTNTETFHQKCRTQSKRGWSSSF